MSGELAEGGASYDLTDSRGRSDGIMLDNLLLRTGGDRAGRRAALRT